MQMADVLEAAELGAELWVRGFGRSMWPLLGSGDAAKVVRCGTRGVRPGDLAAVRTRAGALRLHVVVRTRPLGTARFLGGEETADRILGRVVALRSRGVTLPVPEGLRWPLRLAQRAAAWGAAQPWVEGAGRRAWRAICSSRTRELRRAAVGPLRVRPLGAADRDALLAFAGDHLPLSPRFLERQLTTRWGRVGAAAGAVGRGARLYGFAYLDQYAEEGVPLDGWWIRSVYVAPIARGLGLAGHLVEELCAAARAQGIARVEADVLASNRHSLALFEQHGFFDAPVRRALEAERRLRPKGHLVVMRRDL